MKLFELFKRRTKVLKHEGPIRWVAFALGGNALLTLNGRVKQWDIKSGKALKHYDMEGYQSFHAAISSDGRFLAVGGGVLGPHNTAGSNARVKVWDIATGQEVMVLNWPKFANPSVTLSANGDLLAAGGDEYDVELWHIREKQLRLHINAYTFWDMAFSPDSAILAIARLNPGRVELWDTRAGELLRKLPVQHYSVKTIAFSPDGSLLAGGSSEQDPAPGEVTLWDLRTGHVVRTLGQNTGGVQSIAFSSDGQNLASVDAATHMTMLWDVQTGRLLRSMKGPKGRRWAFTSSVAFSPNSKVLAMGQGMEDLHHGKVVLSYL